MRDELKNNAPFYNWFKDNILVSVVIIMLSWVDIGALLIISSGIFGSERFQAPLSKKSKSIIFWGGIIGIMFEDIPQFVIQVSNS